MFETYHFFILQASIKYGIPKGTLYDNILGKSNRMKILERVALTEKQEEDILELCCELSIMPYNRRTSVSLSVVRESVVRMKCETDQNFTMDLKQSYQWWWAFCKKHNIVSLYYDDK